MHVRSSRCRICMRRIVIILSPHHSVWNWYENKSRLSLYIVLCMCVCACACTFTHVLIIISRESYFHFLKIKSVIIINLLYIDNGRFWLKKKNLMWIKIEDKRIEKLSRVKSIKKLKGSLYAMLIIFSALSLRSFRHWISRPRNSMSVFEIVTGCKQKPFKSITVF